MKAKQKVSVSWLKNFGLILFILGLVGFMAAGILTVEKIALIKDPAFEPSCNINPILSCGSIMETEQAEAFSFPNSLIGIAGFAMISLLGAGIIAGATFKKWFWIGAQIGVVFGMLFIHWLIYQSLYSIGALCPYCMVVWFVMVPIFWYVTLYNFQEGYLHTPTRLRTAIAFAQRNHKEILVTWYLLLFALILERFWYYWQTLL